MLFDLVPKCSKVKYHQMMLNELNKPPPINVLEIEARDLVQARLDDLLNRSKGSSLLESTKSTYPKKKAPKRKFLHIVLNAKLTEDHKALVHSDNLEDSQPNIPQLEADVQPMDIDQQHVIAAQPEEVEQHEEVVISEQPVEIKQQEEVA
ncbi:hypothetical protein AgCh_009548 [Apium graveolens]